MICCFLAVVTDIRQDESLSPSASNVSSGLALKAVTNVVSDNSVYGLFTALIQSIMLAIQ